MGQLSAKPLSFTAGHFKLPFSLQNAMSTNDLGSIERPATIDALIPALRQIGIAADTGEATGLSPPAYLAKTLRKISPMSKIWPAALVSLRAALTYHGVHPRGLVHLGLDAESPSLFSNP